MSNIRVLSPLQIEIDHSYRLAKELKQARKFDAVVVDGKGTDLSLNRIFYKANYHAGGQCETS